MIKLVFFSLLAGGLTTSTAEYYLKYNLIDTIKTLALRLFHGSEKGLTLAELAVKRGVTYVDLKADQAEGNVRQAGKDLVK